MYGKVTTGSKSESSYICKQEEDILPMTAFEKIISDSNDCLYDIHQYLESIETRLAFIDGVGLNCEQVCEKSGVERPVRESFLERTSRIINSLQAVRSRVDNINGRLGELIS